MTLFNIITSLWTNWFFLSVWIVKLSGILGTQPCLSYSSWKLLESAVCLAKRCEYVADHYSFSCDITIVLNKEYDIWNTTFYFHMSLSAHATHPDILIKFSFFYVPSHVRRCEIISCNLSYLFLSFQDGFVEFYEGGADRRNESPWPSFGRLCGYAAAGALGVLTLGAVLSHRS